MCFSIIRPELNFYHEHHPYVEKRLHTWKILDEVSIMVDEKQRFVKVDVIDVLYTVFI